MNQSETREIAPNPDRLYEHLKRVHVEFAGKLSNAEVAENLDGKSALVIVNNKRQARALFELLKGDSTFHLTTNMTADHRRQVLSEVRERLAKGPVLLVATALVEAGVDLDFPVVWRAVAGIDSIAQAAGRCNREGKLEMGQVYIFEPEEGFAPPAELKQNAEIALKVLAVHDDPLSREAITSYFQQLYWSRGAELDAKCIIKQLNAAGNQWDFPFADVAADMKLIEEFTVSLIIDYGPYGLDDKARGGLKFGMHAGAIARAMQRYTVQISPHTRHKLIASGAASVMRPDEFGDQFVVLNNERLYDNYAGFSEDNMEDLGSNLMM